MKRITIAASSDLVTDQRVLRVALCLHHCGYVVSVIGRQMNKDDADFATRHPFNIRRLKLSFNKGALFYAELNAKLPSAILESKPDLLISVDADTLPAAYLASRIANCRWIFDSHEYFSEVPELIGRPIVQSVWRHIEHSFIRLTDARITVGNSLALLFEELYGRPFKVLRNIPLYPDQVQPKLLPIEQPYFIYIGAINKGRGMQEAIRALSSLPDGSLLICGSGDELQNCQDLVKELALQSRVHFKGRISDTECYVYAKNAIAGLNLVADVGLSYHYSLANKYFIYQQCGIPQLCSRLPEYSALEAEFETALLINHLDVEEITIAMKRLMEDNALQFRLKENARAASAKRTWQHEQKALIELVSSVIKQA